jgi:reversibly glycosylated polypeptide / UDP-arabinopyranose mutase
VNALVVPTNSAQRLADFLSAWAPWPWDQIIVVQDEPKIDLSIPEPLQDAAREQLQVFSWCEIDELLPDPTIISRRDSAIRSFGFWRAWHAGAQIIFTLDDDCYPTEDDLIQTHRDNLYRTPAWTSSVQGMRVRGLPYRNPGLLRDVYLSIGLWSGNADLDAISTLAGADPALRIPGAQTRVMPSHQYFPMSGMNLAFRREMTCLMYFAPMGWAQPFARFDDIWCGLVVQRILRHLGHSIVCGHPFVDHRRASDPFRNLVKEAPGIELNERLWESIDGIPLAGRTPHECMLEVGSWLAAREDDYLAGWGRAISLWCGLFDDVAETADPPALAAP